MTRPYLTVDDAAARACVGPGLVRAWVRDGVLPHLRVGDVGGQGEVLIDPADLDNVLASFRVRTPPAGNCRPDALPSGELPDSKRVASEGFHREGRP